MCQGDARAFAGCTAAATALKCRARRSPRRRRSRPAIVVRTRAFGESDKIVTFLTRDLGKLTGIAKGAKHSKRRFVNVLEPFTHVEPSASASAPSSDLAFIDALRAARRAPTASRATSSKFAYASYVLELTDRMVREREAGPETYELVRDALALLERGARRVRRAARLRAAPAAADAATSRRSTAAGAAAAWRPRERRCTSQPARGGILCGALPRRGPRLRHRDAAPLERLIALQQVLVRRARRERVRVAARRRGRGARAAAQLLRRQSDRAARLRASARRALDASAGYEIDPYRALVILPAPVSFGSPHELRDTSGHDGKDREPLQAARLRLPVERDLRRARRAAGTTVRSASSSSATSRRRGGATTIVAARGHRRPRQLDPHAPAGVGGVRPRRRASPTRWSTARSASSASAPISCSGPTLPRVRRRAHRGAPVQPDVQDLHGPGRGHGERRLPAAGDRAGHLRQLPERAERLAPEAAVRHRPDRQVVPQRDHARATSSSARASSSRWRSSSS